MTDRDIYLNALALAYLMAPEQSDAERKLASVAAASERRNLFRARVSDLYDAGFRPLSAEDARVKP